MRTNQGYLKGRRKKWEPRDKPKAQPLRMDRERVRVIGADGKQRMEWRPK